MREDEVIAAVWEGLRQQRELSPDEWFHQMIAAGILDEQGKVLTGRMPEPPDKGGVTPSRVIGVAANGHPEEPAHAGPGEIRRPCPEACRR